MKIPECYKPVQSKREYQALMRFYRANGKLDLAEDCFLLLLFFYKD